MSPGQIEVLKRSGQRESLDLNKFHKVVSFACEGISGVSPSEVEIASHIRFYDGIKSTDIQETLIRAAADLISEQTPNYQHVAGRLINYHLRKQVYGSIEPPHLGSHVDAVVAAGFYDPELLTRYTKDEWDELNKIIDHDRDYSIVYCGMEQFRGKYLMRNRQTKEILETPQMAYMLIAASLFINYPAETRLKWVKDFYDYTSNQIISLPTPIMAGVRSPDKQFSSCVVIEADDSLDSIFSSAHAIGKYVSQRAGIGIGAGRLRALNSPIRGGKVTHTGVIPFYKLLQASVKSCSQGGVRGGAATLHYPIWHLEVEDLLVLKNNKGTEETRVRHIDYSIQFNKLMYERLITGGDITLFSPPDVPGLYEAFFEDQDKFKELYERAERNTRIRKKKIPAIELFSIFMQERKDTGRLYLMNVDHCNTHSSFTVPIRLSNLCQEITLPTAPFENVHDADQGEIALCTLGAINWGLIRRPEDFRKPCELIVRALDELLSIQDYPVVIAEKGTKNRRSLGVGIVNFAYWLAKNDLNYQDIDQSGLLVVDEWMQHWSYYLIKASLELAKERGACGLSQETKYASGILPIDTYKRELDEVCPFTPVVDWDGLRRDLQTHGIRNSTLMALMPAETSALVTNSTNGIEPPRALVSIKQSKDGVLTQVVPEIRRLKNKYDLLWDQKSPHGYLKIAGVMQRYVDQSISTNVSYNPAFYPDDQIPMSVMLQDILLCYKLGLKTLYYQNTNDGAGEVEDKPLSASAPVEDDCDTCKI